MELAFEMTGGHAGVFAAQPLTYAVVVEELPEPERARLRQLVDASGLLHQERPPAAPPPRPGVLTYRVTITSEGGTQRFTFDDITAPPAVRPLLQDLQQRAIAQRTGRR